MKFKRHMELEHGLRQIDIAPLIDMVFQLLIFFMLTSSFIMQPGIKVNLPKAFPMDTEPRQIPMAKYIQVNLPVVNLTARAP